MNMWTCVAETGRAKESDSAMKWNGTGQNWTVREMHKPMRLECNGKRTGKYEHFEASCRASSIQKCTVRSGIRTWNGWQWMERERQKCWCEWNEIYVWLVRLVATSTRITSDYIQCAAVWYAFHEFTNEMSETRMMRWWWLDNSLHFPTISMIMNIDLRPSRHHNGDKFLLIVQAHPAFE